MTKNFISTSTLRIALSSYYKTFICKCFYSPMYLVICNISIHLKLLSKFISIFTKKLSVYYVFISLSTLIWSNYHKTPTFERCNFRLMLTIKCFFMTEIFKKNVCNKKNYIKHLMILRYTSKNLNFSKIKTINPLTAGQLDIFILKDNLWKRSDCL